MNKKQKTNWWINIALLLSFLLTFFLDLTGVIAHQWVGIISNFFAGFHLILHRDWVKSVLNRIFQNQSGKTRRYLVVDFLILFGFILIGFTGLAMSTWLNLPIKNYDAWRQIHIAVSISSLIFILIKLTLHRRWFERMIRKLLTSSVMIPVENVVVQSTNGNSNRMGRREFLVSMGVISTASVIALASASKSLAESIITTETAEINADHSQTIENTETTPQVTETPKVTVQPTETIQAATQTPTVEETQANPSSSPTENNCTVRCPRGCAFPGHCKRYTDTKNNGRCDLGECL